MGTTKQLLYEEKAKREQFISRHKQLKEEISNLKSLLENKRNLLITTVQQLNEINKKIILLKSQK